MVNAAEILERAQSLESQRSPWLSLWSTVQKYISTYELDLSGKQKNRIAINNALFDGRPVTASRIFANGFTGNITPRGAPWFGLKLPDPNANRKPRVKEFLKAQEEYFYSRFESSNFYESMFVLVKNAADYGTGAQYVALDPKTNAIRFMNLPLGSYTIDEDEFGEVDTLFRTFTMQNRNILKKWPGISGKTKADLEQAKFAWSEVIHATFPREDYTHGDKSNRNMPWASVYLLKAYNEVISESGFESFPYVVWRYTKEAGHAYGLGPGLESARDAQMLQQAARTTVRAAHMATDPPVILDENFRGTEELFPGGRNFARSGWIPPTALNIAGTYPIGKDREDQLRRAIDEHYSVDFFLMLAQADRQMTAQEVMERQAEKAAVLSTIIGRFSSEVLDRTFDRIWELDLAAGNIVIEDDDQDIMGADVKVDYSGPLAQIQKRYHQTQGLSQFLNGTLPLAQFNPGILDKLDFDKILDSQADAYKIAPGVVRDDKQTQKIREQKAQAEAAMMQKAQADQALAQMTEVAQKANQPVQPGSPLEAMMGGRQ